MLIGVRDMVMKREEMNLQAYVFVCQVKLNKVKSTGTIMIWEVDHLISVGLNNIVIGMYFITKPTEF